VDYIYNRFVTGFVLKLGGQTSKILDKGSVELIGPYGLEMGLFNISKNISKLDTGLVTSYALYILIALVLYVQIPYIYSEDISVLLLILVSLTIVTNTYFSDSTYLTDSKLDNDGISENNIDVYKEDNVDHVTQEINPNAIP
jgi:NADH-ubiquinone oxidoreductase chain 5